MGHSQRQWLRIHHFLHQNGEHLNTKQGRQLDRARSSAQQIALKARHLRRSALHEIAAARGHKGISLECARRPYQPTRPQRTSASTLGACWHCASTSIPLRKPNPNPKSIRSRSPRLDSRLNRRKRIKWGRLRGFGLSRPPCEARGPLGLAQRAGQSRSRDGKHVRGMIRE